MIQYSRYVDVFIAVLWLIFDSSGQRSAIDSNFRDHKTPKTTQISLQNTLFYIEYNVKDKVTNLIGDI